MNEFEEFIHKTYTVGIGSRVPVKEIYHEFHTWLLEYHGVKAANSVTQREVCAALKLLPDYVYQRYAEGYCLRGCTKILVPAPAPKLSLNIITPAPKNPKPESKPESKPRIIIPKYGKSKLLN